MEAELIHADRLHSEEQGELRAADLRSYLLLLLSRLSAHGSVSCTTTLILILTSMSHKK